MEKASLLRFRIVTFQDCDLRGCDFTGVQFEKSGQLTSFAVCPTEDAILAHYRDGVIRRFTHLEDKDTVAHQAGLCISGHLTLIKN